MNSYLKPPYSKEVQEEAVSYDLTTDTIDSPPVGLGQDLVESLFYRAMDNDPSVIPELKKLINQYPNYPVLGNYLSNAYHAQGKQRQALAVERENLKLNPDYFFARINQVAHHLNNNKLDQVRDLLGSSLRLSDFHRVDRKIHVSEWISFYQIVGLYYCESFELEPAQSILNAFYHYGFEGDKADLLEDMIVSARLKKMKERMLEDKRSEILVKMPNPVRKFGTLKYYEPGHEILNGVYEYGEDFPKEVLNQILALPRESAASDMMGMLDAEIHNAPIYLKNNEEDACYVTVHLLFILSEMKANESIDIALSFYALHPDVIHFILGDFISWQPIYGLVEGNLDAVAEWVRRPGISGEGKSYVVDAVFKIAIHAPDRREEIIAWIADLMGYLSDCKPGDQILDTNLVSAMVGEAVKIGAHELIPLMRTLYEKNYVSVFRCGTLETMIEDMGSDLYRERNSVLPNMIAFYQKLGSSSQSDILPDYSDLSFGLSQREDQFLTRAEKKETVERNDPCPCGSGKKFKKCCL